VAARKKKTGVRRRKTTRKAAAKSPRKSAKRAAKPAKRTARPRPPPAPPAGRWALALAGDWSRGAFVAGVLDALHRRGVLARAGVAAASGSAGLAAALAALGKWDALKTLFAELTPRRIARPRHPWIASRAGRFWLASATGVPSLYRTDTELRRLVQEVVDPLALREAPMEIHFVALDLRRGATRSVSSRSGAPGDVLAALLAAASTPVLLPPVAVGRDRAPCVQAPTAAVLAVLGAALARGGAPAADRVLVVDTETAPARREGSYRDITDVAARTAELLPSPGTGVREAVLLHALATAREALGPSKFADVMQALPAAARDAMPDLLERHGRPLVHLHPTAAAAAHALELDPAGSRAAFLAGGAAAGPIEA